MREVRQGRFAFIVLPLILLIVVFGGASASAATSPSLGEAGYYGILSSTYTNTAVGTTVYWDIGYTTMPAVPATVVNGIVHVADANYTQAGLDQATALANLNSQAGSSPGFTFAPGAIDLASDVTHGPVGIYTPGFYDITGAADIGGGGTITLDGAGTYIFRMDGALGSSANSKVVYINGASPCDVWWIPTAATTLGANSTFVGTVIDASGIAIGDTVTWEGRALAFGGTVSTVRDTINKPSCALAAYPSRTPTATILYTGNGFIAPWGLVSIALIILFMAIFTVYEYRRKQTA
jgi:hypothetical protein